MKLETSATLQLKKIQVEKFKLEEDIKGNNKFILAADFDPIELVDSNNNEKYRGFHFTLKVNDKAKNSALKCRIEITAIFDVDKNLSKEEQVKFVLYNGLSILYGITRGMVFQACSILPPNRRMLPTVNIVKLIESKMKKLKKENELPSRKQRGIKP